MFDSNAMHELAHLKADRYQRAGGGGAHKVYNSSKAFHDSRGYREMSTWRRAVYEATTLWRDRAETIMADFKWDIRPDHADIETFGEPFPPVNKVGRPVYGIANTF